MHTKQKQSLQARAGSSNGVAQCGSLRASSPLARKLELSGTRESAEGDEANGKCLSSWGECGEGKEGGSNSATFMVRLM